jgi:hypothetical protein
VSRRATESTMPVQLAVMGSVKLGLTWVT